MGTHRLNLDSGDDTPKDTLAVCTERTGIHQAKAMEGAVCKGSEHFQGENIEQFVGYWIDL